MTINRDQRNLLTFLLITFSSAAELIGPRTNEDVISSLLCPEPDVIFPCTCYIYQGNDRAMDCSNVTSEEELGRIFELDFPTNVFTKFIMTGNRHIRTLSEGIFGDKKFHYILITNGTLNKVEDRAFLGSSYTLGIIDLHSNELTYFPSGEIHKYGNLESLNLVQNRLKNLSNIASQSVMDIKMDENPIGRLSADFIQDATELQIFTCSSCELTEILPGTFAKAPQLRFIDLGYNEITSVPAGAFALHSSYSCLNLRNNKLTEIEVGSIKGVTFEMEIQFNQLQQLSEDIWRPVMETTTHFSVYKNPFLCDCDIAWLITNSTFMKKLSGRETCVDGTYFQDLDPVYYEEMC